MVLIRPICHMQHFLTDLMLLRYAGLMSQYDRNLEHLVWTWFFSTLLSPLLPVY